MQHPSGVLNPAGRIQHLTFCLWQNGNKSGRYQYRQAISKVYTNNKENRTPSGVRFFEKHDRQIKSLNADVRWTSAFCQLDGGNAIRKGIGLIIRCPTLQDHKQCSACYEDAPQNGAEGELFVEQHCGQDDGDHDAELIDWNDL